MSEFISTARERRNSEWREGVQYWALEEVVPDPSVRQLLANLMKQVSISPFAPGEDTCCAFSATDTDSPKTVTINPRCGPGHGVLFTIPIWLNDKEFSGIGSLNNSAQYQNTRGDFVKGFSSYSPQPEEGRWKWSFEAKDLPSPLAALSPAMDYVGCAMTLAVYGLADATVDHGVKSFFSEYFEVYDYLRESWNLAIRILEDPTFEIEYHTCVAE